MEDMKMSLFAISVIIVCNLVSNVACADVLINLDNTEEVSISNTQVDAHYTLKIEEPDTKETVINTQLKQQIR